MDILKPWSFLAVSMIPTITRALCSFCFCLDDCHERANGTGTEVLQCKRKTCRPQHTGTNRLLSMEVFLLN